MRKITLCLIILSISAINAPAAPEDGFANIAPPKVMIQEDTPAAENPADVAPPPESAPPESADPLMTDIGSYWDEGASAAATDAARAADDSPAAADERPNLLLRGLMSLCGTLALILLVYTGVKRWGRKVPLLAGHSLGNLMGRLALTPQASLHFVRTNGEVLVLGVTQQTVSLLRSFDAVEFDAQAEQASKQAPRNGDTGSGSGSDFLAQLKESQGAMRLDRGMDEELDLLKGDLQRLQQYFQDSTRGRREP